ncbi:LLM class F420-dependent oxidoreductase [Nocardia sp. alder85J]|uniref:LLM class F420-dependent oxidoreductase n=1 Tax=Nocardia sp. alder85J TaxID=2862949 RepID=UPI001CD4FEC6|nr:LLM class F420-dependent oxidoreductase [Nocardia sp. alder85J]MCX4098447.1 LLM class F420-dependent oxidoreductase [Nocardia sp. alder85J]
MTMDHSVFLPQGFVGELAGLGEPVDLFERLTVLARAAEHEGYHSVWVSDHLMTVPPSPHPLFESWTTAAALARDTERIRIGHMVTCNNYRNPGLQAKMASTLDVLSHGRYTFGIGAGWYEPDYQAYGYEFGTAPERLRQLEEALQVIRSMWTEPETTFTGGHYTLRGAINEPKGVQLPHIPIMVAGGGEQVTLKLVAQYADACNVSESPAGLRRKFAALQRHCKEADRDYDEIRRTVLTLCIIADTDEQARALVPPWAPAVYPGDVGSYGLIGTPGTIRARLAEYEAAGAQELVITFDDQLNPDGLRRFAAEFMS